MNKTYKKTVYLSKVFFNRINALLKFENFNEISDQEKDEFYPQEYHLIHVGTVEFQNGNVLDIDLCSNQTYYYDDLRLIDRQGYELKCYEPLFCIDKEIEINYLDDTYIVEFRLL